MSDMASTLEVNKSVKKKANELSENQFLFHGFEKFWVGTKLPHGTDFVSHLSPTKTCGWLRFIRSSLCIIYFTDLQRFKWDRTATWDSSCPPLTPTCLPLTIRISQWDQQGYVAASQRKFIHRSNSSPLTAIYAATISRQSVRKLTHVL